MNRFNALTGCRLLALLALSLLLYACGGDETTRPDSDRDGPGDRRISASEVREPTPRPEPLSRYGNRSPYQVFGRNYYVMESSEGYRERGLASWYGKKFHGRRTSSGEPYDMYKATAAHRSLPLPTYAEVTNLDNGRKVVVKINDRGPFHDDRIIDLSYGAAIKLDMADQGTARVEVRAITFDRGSVRQAPPVKRQDGTFLQAGAFRSRDGAERLSQRLIGAYIQPVSIQPGRKNGRALYRVWIGPLASESEIRQVTDQVQNLGLDRPHRVQR